MFTTKMVTNATIKPNRKTRRAASPATGPTNREFLDALFDGDAFRAHVAGFSEDPGKLDALGLRHYWGGGPADVTLGNIGPDQNGFFCISVFSPDPVDGRYRRRKVQFDTCQVIVFDDVNWNCVDPAGTSAKVSRSKIVLDPSWVLETSPGNCQVGYNIRGGDKRGGKVNVLLDALVGTGLVSDGSDPGMKGVTRYVRLPVGTNTKKKYGAGGWTHRLLEWNPERTYTLEDLADAHGVRGALDAADDDLGAAGAPVSVDPDEDWILGTLDAAGLILSEDRTKNLWHVECPFVIDHTGGDTTGTAYLGGGLWSCHHGHCVDRGHGEFSDKLRSNHPVTAKAALHEVMVKQFPAVAMPGSRPPSPLDDWVFLRLDNSFFNRSTGETIGRGAFNLALVPHTPPVNIVDAAGAVIAKQLSPEKTLMHHRDGVSVYAPMYNPVMADTIFASGKRRYVNSYISSLVPDADPNWQAGTAWQMVEKYYVDALGQDQFRQLFQWLAHNVQNPGLRINWTPVVVGVQGDGKSTLEAIMGRVMGADNVQSIGVSTLEAIMGRVMGADNVQSIGVDVITSSFTDWAHGACVGVLEELRIHGQSRHSVLDKIKPLLTNEVIQIHPKGQKPRMVLNTQNYVALTNEMDALALDAGDRRYAVLKTRFEDRTELLRDYPSSFWTKMYAQINGNIGELRGWLLDFDLTGFDRTQAPAQSVHHKAMAAAAMGSDQRTVQEAIVLGAVGVGPDVLTTKHLNVATKDLDGTVLKSSQISKALSNEGWAKRKKTLFWGGEDVRIYTRRKALLGDATAKVLRDHLDATLFPEDDDIF